jgi:beta-glucanase (GH16 family)
VKTIAPAVLVANAFVIALGAMPDVNPLRFELVWADEFEKDGRPDPAKWTYETGFVRNDELQWYQPQNAYCRDGHLVIEARREQVPNPGFRERSRQWQEARRLAEYTSASVTTKGLASWRYGRFLMRGRIDTREGLWPAWWTLGVDGEWPDGGEIDMMESYRGLLLANVAWGSGKRRVPTWDSVRTPIDTLGPGWREQFHEWRMDWDRDAIRLYVDDRLLNETALADTVNPAGHNPFHAPQYMLINLAVGGANGGDPSKTSFPARVEVDYVRVFSATQEH